MGNLDGMGTTDDYHTNINSRLEAINLMINLVSNNSNSKRSLKIVLNVSSFNKKPINFDQICSSHIPKMVNRLKSLI